MMRTAGIAIAISMLASLASCHSSTAPDKSPSIAGSWAADHGGVHISLTLTETGAYQGQTLVYWNVTGTGTLSDATSGSTSHVNPSGTDQRSLAVMNGGAEPALINLFSADSLGRSFGQFTGHLTATGTLEGTLDGTVGGPDIGPFAGQVVALTFNPQP
jgi:hypothetical protein